MRTQGVVTVILLCLGMLGGCTSAGSGYDAEASREFRAAWEKRRAGDDAGYRAGLALAAKRKGTWAGDRAARDLELVDDPGGADSLLARIVHQASMLARGASLPYTVGGPAAQKPGAGAVKPDIAEAPATP